MAKEKNGISNRMNPTLSESSYRTCIWYEEIKMRQKLIRRVEFIVCIYSEMVRFIQIREMMV